MYPRVVLKSGRDTAVRGGHPWVFSGAVERVDDDLADGDMARVVDARDTFLGLGYFNRKSAIRVRVLTRDPRRAVDGAFWRERIAAAAKLRRSLFGAFDAPDGNTEMGERGGLQDEDRA